MRFALYKAALQCCRFFFNPYRVCKTDYGETPIETFRKIAAAARIGPEDRYLELGSGLGQTCVWAHLYLGCQVKGVEWVPLFAWLSKLLYPKVDFVRESMFDTDLRSATVVYYYHLSETRPLFEEMQKGARLITISAPIQSDVFTVIETLDVEFPWGITQAYVQCMLK